MSCAKLPVADPYQNAQDVHLLTTGGNWMLAALGIQPGWAQQPGLYFVGDPRTGFYQPEPLTLGVTLGGRPAFFYERGQFQIYSQSALFSAILGTALLSANRLLELPDESGTLATQADCGGIQAFNWAPPETIDGTNQVFTMGHARVVAGTTRIYYNGARMLLGLHYDEVGANQVRFRIAPAPSPEGAFQAYIVADYGHF